MHTSVPVLLSYLTSSRATCWVRTSQTRSSNSQEPKCHIRFLKVPALWFGPSVLVWNNFSSAQFHLRLSNVLPTPSNHVQVDLSQRVRLQRDSNTIETRHWALLIWASKPSRKLWHHEHNVYYCIFFFHNKCISSSAPSNHSVLLQWLMSVWGICQFLRVPSFSASNNSLIGHAQATYVHMWNCN